MTILSEEMEKEINDIVDKRISKSLLIKNIDIGIRECERSKQEFNLLETQVSDLEDEINDLKDTIESFEMETPTSQQIVDRFKPIEEAIDNLGELVVSSRFIKEEDIERLVGKTMLNLMPNFNMKISMEVKKHFVALAEYVIKHFKEKE